MGIVKFSKSDFIGPGFLQVVEGLFSKCDQEEMALFAGLARHIWLRRNAFCMVEAFLIQM
jgi:hypothetical protein